MPPRSNAGATGSERKDHQHREHQRILIDSKLPAHERLQQLITGGIKRKENGLRFHGVPVEAAGRAAEFILGILTDSAARAQTGK
jgi:hypothetical protein